MDINNQSNNSSSKKIIGILIVAILIIGGVILMIVLLNNRNKNENINNSPQPSNNTVVTNKSELRDVYGSEDALIEKVDSSVNKKIIVPAGKALVVYKNNEITNILVEENSEYLITDNNTNCYFVKILELYVTGYSSFVLDNVKYDYGTIVRFKVTDPLKFIEKYLNLDNNTLIVFNNEVRDYIEEGLSNTIINYFDSNITDKTNFIDIMNANEAYYGYISTTDYEHEYYSDNGVAITSISINSFKKI